MQPPFTRLLYIGGQCTTVPFEEFHKRKEKNAFVQKANATVSLGRCNVSLQPNLGLYGLRMLRHLVIDQERQLFHRFDIRSSSSSFKIKGPIASGQNY